MTAQRRLAEQVGQRQEAVVRRRARVITVNTDGTVVLSMDGVQVVAWRLRSYVPEVGDEVVLDLPGPIVIGAIARD